LYANLGSVAAAEGDLDGARTRFEAALALAEEHLGKDHPLVAKNLSNLASVHRRLGERDRARDLYERARQILVAHHGDDHPALIFLTNSIGALLFEMQDLAGAARKYREVLA